MTQAINSNCVSQRPATPFIEGSSLAARRITAIALAIIGSLVSFVFLPAEIAGLAALSISLIALFGALGDGGVYIEGAPRPPLYYYFNPFRHFSNWNWGGSVFVPSADSPRHSHRSHSQPAGYVGGTPVSVPGSRSIPGGGHTESPFHGARDFGLYDPRSNGAAVLPPAMTMRQSFEPSAPRAMGAGCIPVGRG
jgi:hypothetical protein